MIARLFVFQHPANGCLNFPGQSCWKKIMMIAIRWQNCTKLSNCTGVTEGHVTCSNKQSQRRGILNQGFNKVKNKKAERIIPKYLKDKERSHGFIQLPS